MDQDLCLVWLYCVIDGVLRSIGRVRQRGPAPELTDAEVLTIQLWGEIRGLPNDASVWRDATLRAPLIFQTAPNTFENSG